jgi:hypothetical protein
VPGVPGVPGAGGLAGFAFGGGCYRCSTRKPPLQTRL